MDVPEHLDPLLAVEVPVVADVIAEVRRRVHLVVVDGQHGLGEVPVVGLEDGRLVAQDVEGEAQAGGQAVRLEDGAADALDVAPVHAVAQAEADVEPFPDLPGILDESLEAGVAGVGVVTRVLVGQVGPRVAVAVVVVVIDVVAQLAARAGEAVAAPGHGPLELGPELELVRADEEVLGVVGHAGVGPEAGPVGVVEVAGAVVEHVVVEDEVGVGIEPDLGIEVVAALEVVGLEVEEGRRAEDLVQVEADQPVRANPA